MTKEFFAFLKNYGVVGMAIAVIIGGKLNEFVSSLVNDLLMPLIFKPVLESAGIADIKLLNYGGIFYGKVIGASIDFLVVAIIIFIFSKQVLKEETVTKK